MCIGLLISRPLPACSEQVQRASINGAVPASFVGPAVGHLFVESLRLAVGRALMLGSRTTRMMVVLTCCSSSS